jgi:hypothetical protein
MKIYIQKDNYADIPHHFDCACALYGAIESALDWKLITYETMLKMPLQAFYSNVFVGSVEFMQDLFNRLEIDNPRVPDNSNRPEEFIKLGEAKQRIENGETLFVKPKQIKLFTGMVTDKQYLVCLNPYPDDTDVIVSKPFTVPILSEWRCYVAQRVAPIVDIKCYSGSPFVTPDKYYILDLFNSHTSNFPKAYTIDVAILENGQNVVVEYNDMWAIGNYGIDNATYLSLLKDRYFEIIRS